MKTEELPKDDEQLAEIHKNLCEERRRLDAQVIELSNRIGEVCEARILAKYGVKKGDTVECLDRKQIGTVVSFSQIFCCEHRPWLNVNFTNNPNGHGSGVVNYRVIPSSP